MKICVSLIFVLVMALQALCFGGKLRIEETVFDFNEANTACLNDCEYPDIEGFTEVGTNLILKEYYTYNSPFECETQADTNGYFRFCDVPYYSENTQLFEYQIEGLNAGFGIWYYILHMEGMKPKFILLDFPYRSSKRGTIKGKIYDNKYFPVADVVVSVHGQYSGFYKQRTSDNENSFEFKDLKPGRYFLKAKKGRKTLKSDTINLKRNMTYEAYIEW